jgi:putative ABC transport system permease protein
MLGDEWPAGATFPGGIASAILIGAFAGLMPAVRASRTPPTVALRTA